MALAQPFTTTTPSIASYGALDLASGTAITPFFLGTTIDDQIIKTTSFYSQTVITLVSSGASGSYVKKHDVDFDVTFKKPITMDGDAVLNVAWGLKQTDSGATTTSKLIVFVRHWDGTTETDLATNESREIVETVQNDTEVRMEALDLVLARTHFAAGETLRVTIEYWAKGAAATSDYFFAHDPKNRAVPTYESATNYFGTDTTICTLFAPVIIDTSTI